MQLPLFRVHLSVLRGDEMARETVDVAAPSTLAARAQAVALPHFRGAIVLKVKQVKS